MVRVAHEVRDPTSQRTSSTTSSSSAHRPCGVIAPSGRSRRTPRLSTAAPWRATSPRSCPKSSHHTWEACVTGNPEKKIPPCMKNGNPYRSHKTDQKFFDGYNDLFSSPLSTLAIPLKYRDTNGNIGGDFNVSEVCHVARCGVARHSWMTFGRTRGWSCPCSTHRAGQAQPAQGTRSAPPRANTLPVGGVGRGVPAGSPAGALGRVGPGHGGRMRGDERPGRHYDKLEEATVAEAVATSEQPPAEEAAYHAANGVPKVLLACTARFF